MADKVMTAPLALIKVNGVTIGKMRNISVTETITRGKVSGLGELTPQERPALEWSGSFNAGFYLIDLDTTGIRKAFPRKAGSIQEIVDTLLLDCDGFDISLLKKVTDVTNTTTGLISGKYKEFATIVGCFIERESFDISEGQISGQNQDFTYLNPILFVTT